MVRVHWRSKLTGYEGHGEWRSEAERAVLQAWIEQLDSRQDQMLEHWLESSAFGQQQD
jgi:hypothetical protein